MTDTEQVSAMAQDAKGERIVLLIRFTTKPGKQDEFLRSLSQVVDRMSEETSFIDAVISENVDRTGELLMYETWLGSRESWLSEELPRLYRNEYEGVLAGLVDSREVAWFKPLTGLHRGRPLVRSSRE